MQVKEAFGKAFKYARKSKNLTQEDFSTVSSRTYISIIERGEKAITIEKLDELAKQLGIHPVALLALTYSEYDKETGWKELLDKSLKQLEQIADSRT